MKIKVTILKKRREMYMCMCEQLYIKGQKSKKQILITNDRT